MASPGHGTVLARATPVRRQIHRAIEPLQLTTFTGNALFPSRNWHQSLCGWHAPDKLGALQLACRQLQAHAFCFRLDRFVCTGKTPGSIHWSLRSSHGEPLGFRELLTELRGAYGLNGIDDDCMHTAHVTLSYFAEQCISNTQIEPIDWVIDLVELVVARGHGDTYRYETIEAFPLLPMLHIPPAQFSLLG